MENVEEYTIKGNCLLTCYNGDADIHIFDRSCRHEFKKMDSIDYGKPIGDGIFGNDSKEYTTKQNLLRNSIWGISSEKTKITGQNFGNFGYGYRVFRQYLYIDNNSCMGKETPTTTLKRSTI